MEALSQDCFNKNYKIMSKNTLIYLSIILLVVIMAWFFVKKFRSVSNNPEPNSLVKDEEKVMPGNNSVIELPDGLEVQDIVIGSGQEAKNGNTISAHYLGTLSSGQKFDSSYDRGEPFSFVLGRGEVIKGWDLGLVGMRVGGKRKLVIPPELGYGNRNVGNGVIPPNSTLYFDVELVSVEILKRSD